MYKGCSLSLKFRQSYETPLAFKDGHIIPRNFQNGKTVFSRAGGFSAALAGTSAGRCFPEEAALPYEAGAALACMFFVITARKWLTIGVSPGMIARTGIKTPVNYIKKAMDYTYGTV